MTALAPDGRPLVGRFVRLDRAVLSDAGPLFRALDDERVYAGNYAGGPAGRPRSVDAMAASLGAALSTPGRTPYTVRLVQDSAAGSAGDVVGTSSLFDLFLVDERLHLGWTAYAPAAWGSQVNPECKLLLLGHAFDDCGFGRVKIQTDAVNTRSQEAIERLGAVREGVLRRHKKRADGTFRDTVVYSILKDEWPAVQAGLQERLG
ncbi:GNAT family N-acetyltransferase [Nakamurella sp. YIM 132087]|uniref:GNAT family N-acetyltransferase n=1 Tax=Nakamurella alba TaxID=2665158 RepID=A0A7K1FMT1_9ACTN|nr:GNAT family protein [Nakamurella alba]MTD14084.1 GNAT family N-acetyltransferase [Nakamurella alba]